MLNTKIYEASKMPYDEDAERAILGSLIVYPEIIDSVLNKLKIDDFYLQKHKVIYETIIDLFNQGKPLEIIILKDELSRRGKLEFVGGISYLYQISEEGVPPDTAFQIVDIIKEKSILRSLIESAQNIIAKATSKDPDVNELLEEAGSAIFQIMENKEARDGYSIDQYSFGEQLKKSLKIINELAKKETLVTGLPTGFHDLDMLTTGFHPGDLIVIAARTGMGKTSLALSILHHLSIVNEIPAVFFSLEMSGHQITIRLLSKESKIPLKKIISGFLSESEIEKLTKDALKIMNAPLHIVDVPSLSILDLKAKARKFKKEKDIKIIVVDYLQLLRLHRKVENRQVEVAEISRELKSLAKELGIPVVALAQLSRQTEMRADKIPQLSDLRESGSIEQDADLVLFIHRPAYYKDKKDISPEEKKQAELIIAKHRNGETGKVLLEFIGETTEFRNIQASSVISIERIQSAVCDYYKIDKDKLLESKDKQAVVARQVAMYLSKKLTNKSLSSIARSFNKKDHTTILNAVQKVEKEQELKKVAEQIKSKLINKQETTSYFFTERATAANIADAAADDDAVDL
jgi:replicative DNA helicase